MPLVQRTITGTLEDGNGTLLVNTLVEITPLETFGDGGILVVAGHTENVLTDGSGVYSVSLYTKVTGSVRYQCNIGNDAFIFELSDGPTTSLDQIISGDVHPTITTASLPNANAGTPYSQTVSVSSGNPPITFSLASGSLPTGLTLNSSGVISGTPTGSGSSSFTVRATDVDGDTDDQAFSLNVVDSSAPSVPAGLAQDASTALSITASWSASTDNVAVAGYQLRVNGGSPIDVGNVLSYEILSLSPGTSYNVEVRAKDAVPNFSAWSSVVAMQTTLMLDGFASSHAEWWGAKKTRTTAVNCVQVTRASDSATFNVGFDANGLVDLTAYAAIGTGTEQVTKIYGHFGNFDYTRIGSGGSAILRTNPDHGMPEIFSNGAGWRIAGFTDWNGLADANFYFAYQPQSQLNGFLMAGGDTHRYLYFGGGISTRELRWDTSSTAESQYFQTSRLAAVWQRFQFDGGGGSQATIARMFQNGIEQTRDAFSGAAHGITLANETGLAINSDLAGGNALNNSFFGVGYLGYELTSDQVTQIDAVLKHDFFTYNKSQLVVAGTSLALGYPMLTPNKFYEQLQALLEAQTGTIWDVNVSASEVAAKSARVLQLCQSAAYDRIDTNYDNCVFLAWPATNDWAIAPLVAVATTEATVLSILQGAKELGAAPFLMTEPPRTDLGAGNASFETDRQTYCAAIDGVVAGVAVAVAHLETKPEFDSPADVTPPNYQADNVHMQQPGYGLCAGYAFAVISPTLI